MEATGPTDGKDGLRFELELEPRQEGEPIAGVLRRRDGESRPFEGWAELTRLLAEEHAFEED